MTSITNAQLGWNDAGTPVSDQFDDVYFSNVNGLEETRYVFLHQNHLSQRWQTYDQRRFVIAETGFGTGLNFLAVWQWFDLFKQQNPDSPLKELHFVSFEKYPLSQIDLIKAHNAWPELANYAEKLQKHYPIAVPECHRVILEDGAITLDLWFGDIKDCMPMVPVTEEGFVDAWFLDGFAPSKNPDMWNQDLFDSMAKLARIDCTCATFTAAGFVRRGLIDAGFDIKKVKGFGTKRDMLAGRLTNKIKQTNYKPWFHRQTSSASDTIAIIGGGIASATLAKALIRRGKNVTLYCQDELAAQGASGNHQGAVYPLLNGSHQGVSRVFAPAFLFAKQFVEQIAETIEFEHDWCGVTQLMWNDEAEVKLERMLQGNFDTQLVHRLDAQQTSEKIGLPIDVASVHYPLGGWLSPVQMTQGLMTQLSSIPSFKAQFATKIQALEWDKNNNNWDLVSGEKRFIHDTVVVANGHQFAQLEQTSHIPLGQVKGQVSHVPTNDDLQKINTVLCYDGYMTPVNPATRYHCVGASYDRNNLDHLFDPAAQQTNGDKLRKCIPNQEWPKQVNTSGNHSRQGIRCVSRDHLPFIGNVGDLGQTKAVYQNLQKTNQDQAKNVPIYPNLFCMLGLGSRGLSSSPLLAETLASQICGDPLPLPIDVLEQLHPSRMWVRKLRKGKAITEC
ncbi:bifunctional tRNA (5-methylaminomethyl-2-thiouridine)(34)-methyltransferase MnmD/FAD-dependent 5-carboxymethylaminomethyl-2-thiouridine(34) oxidoreductase MnmC [Vibrio ostreicida]|uniref:bifunctional tRNA (5-methylaminomethyl-2-thiouridine)(34)-methyltransferase MnmD/FAD-dependent 5-carboxymethylaminomethyl-2-thiouridine(34) oxidoreductase MnmC n=1 Tax=Vibrio ostreicida TaxID=526588 RepID=UPI0009704772|nr:bifunctional tRNA (5-methylaminomethyl-2-thiouridine)(34)-methyltransferase MnmD/FAD-dependent 5-carboxymethylaminomethyl-2-thiouridine(34) oxidoreductase MnmC [Vibrio ostreicida]